MKFLGSVSDLLSVLETDFTPCGFWRPITANLIDCWRAEIDASPNVATQAPFSTPPALRPIHPLSRWWTITSDEALDIGSVSLLVTDSLAGPLRVAKVSLCPALTASADV
jgi:hypothetical protein